MTVHTWLTFVLATAVLLAIPGPTVLMVIGQSLGAGRRHALPLVAGVALGDLTAMTLSLAGLGALLAASAAAFTLLKWIGAAYLVYLGVMLWRAPVSADGFLSTLDDSGLDGQAASQGGATLLLTSSSKVAKNPQTPRRHSGQQQPSAKPTW